jgi:hypothetical protein
MNIQPFIFLLASRSVALRQRGDAEAQRGGADMNQHDNADAPTRQRLQCRDASATIPKHKRSNVEAPARRYKRTSATISRHQRGDVEAPSSRRWRFIAMSALRLDITGWSFLSRLSSLRRVYKCRPART